MKKKWIISACATAAIVLFLTTASGAPLVDDPKYNLLQRRAQVTYFAQALGEFGASSPQEAVRLWVRGDQTRNGVYKYAVAGPEEKKRLESKWGKPEDSFYIIGGSSPWLERYEVTRLQKSRDGSYRATVRYYWTSSAGPSAPTQEELTLISCGGKWCVGSATGNGNY